ncbi:lactoylglutathione lyase [Caulobacter rhizosphaerae]|uniref:Lactoylglutathione lyase n=1 Tax=Caulobacter rhizosphaerae TaxID=2010972 RepID=A0ABU1MVK4_9CAUL|nr:VOC family protein [Caulobacter rhizosphaerae]MDR6530219.1 lactoylglutathione lyase [Caulobacter rhizosphaerae]
MRLAHVALWTEDLEGMARFWRLYFKAEVGEAYHSRRQPGFVSRFATLPGGEQVELMSMPWLARLDTAKRVGWDHVAVAVGSEAAVDAMVARLRRDRFEVSPPRWTGDGFYEAVVRAPGGVPIEITA